MMSRSLRKLLSTFALAAACGAFVANTSHAQTATPPPDARAVPFSRGSIHVSGLWTIDVKNTDGTLARRVEFENALTSDGMAALIRMMVPVNEEVGGGLNIVATGASGGGPCAGPLGCLIGPTANASSYSQATNCNPSNASFQYNCFATLSTTTYQASVTLTGSLTATQSGTIAKVATRIGECVRDNSPTPVNPHPTPASCVSQTGGLGVTFTLATLPAAQQITLLPGQVAQFKVVISFS